MSVLYRLVSFTIGFTLAVSATFLLPAHTHFNHECPRFEGIDPSERFYTLEEGKRLLGRHVRYARASQYSQNAGRVASLDMIVSDKFFVVVDWDIAPDDGKPGLRWYSRDVYERDLIEE
jgi:hypothetical protein